MGDKDIARIYLEGKRSGERSKLQDMYKQVLHEAHPGQTVMNNMFDKSVAPKSGASDKSMQSQAKEWKVRTHDKRSITAIATDMEEGGIPILPKDAKSDSDLRIHFSEKEIGTLNNTIDVEDQLKIKNLLNTSAKEKMIEIFTPYIKSKKKSDQDSVLAMIMYSSLDVGEFAYALATQKEDPEINLLNANILLDPGYTGVFSPDEFIISPNARTSTGQGVEFQDLVRDGLRVLKNLGSGGKQAGPYEAAMQVISGGTIDQKGKGDIAVQGQSGRWELLELKAENGRMGPEEYPSRKDVVDNAIKSFESVVRRYVPTEEVQEVMQGVETTLKDHGSTYDTIYSYIETLFGKRYNVEELRAIRHAIIAPMVSFLYKGKDSINGRSLIVDGFVEYSSGEEMRAIVAGELFRMYKDEKTGSQGGQWDRLVGLNLTEGYSMCIFDAGEQVAQAVRSKTIRSSMPNLIATGPSAARDYMWQLLPI